MGAPGTLIPAEVQSCNLPSFGLDTVSITPPNDNIAKFGTSGSEVSSFIGSQLEGQTGKVMKRNQTERSEYDLGKLLPSLSRPFEGRTTQNSYETSSGNLLNVNNQEKGEPQAYETINLLDADMLIMSNNEDLSVYNELQTECEIIPERNKIGYTLPFESNSYSEDFLVDNSVGKVFVDPLFMVLRTLEKN